MGKNAASGRRQMERYDVYSKGGFCEESTDYFQPHLHIRNAFVKEISSPEQAGKSGYLVKTTLENGDYINIGGNKTNFSQTALPYL